MSPEPPLTEDSRLRPADGVLSRILGGEAVLVSLGSGEYFGLNAVGTRIWELVGETGRVGDVVQALEDEYDVAAEQAREETLALLAELLERGLVVPA